MGNQTSKEVDASQVKIGDKVGSGFFGNVKWAKVEGIGRVALKTARRQQEKEWLRNEALVQQEASHERVVSVYGCDAVGGEWTLIMEYLPGPNLEQLLLMQNQSFSFVQRILMCYDIVVGLNHLHNLSSGRCIIHNDLKPDNILITDKLRCKIADFGCSRLYDESGKCLEGCPVNLFCIPYAAPEVLKADLQAYMQSKDTENEEFYYTYDSDNSSECQFPIPHCSSDIYSLALVIHMILYRRLPWGEMNVYDIISMVLDGYRPADKKHISATHEELQHARFLWQVMVKCWHQDPNSRPTASDLSEMFGLWLSCHGLVEYEEYLDEAD